MSMLGQASYVNFGAGAPPQPTVLFRVVVESDTNFDPVLTGFGATDIDWDFGGGAANITGGSGTQSIAITGAPVIVQASTFATPAPWSLNLRADNVSQVLEINDQVTGIDIANNNVGATSDSVLTNLPNLIALDIRNNGFASKDLTGLPLLDQLFIQGNNITSLPNFNTSPLLRILNFGSNGSTGVLDISSLDKLQVLQGAFNDITNVVFPATSVISNFQMNNNKLTPMASIAAFAGSLTIFIVSNNDLLASEIDEILIELDAGGFTGNLRYDAQTPTGPNDGNSSAFDSNRSAAGATALSNLLGAGVTRTGTYA